MYKLKNTRDENKKDSWRKTETTQRELHNSKLPKERFVSAGKVFIFPPLRFADDVIRITYLQLF